LSSEVIFDSNIEKRIEAEVLAGADNEYERAIKWVSYLERQLTVPFQAECICATDASPLKLGALVEVTGLNTKMCQKNMFVTIDWKGETCDVPLSQLEGINVDDETLRGLTDWNYWVSCEYSF